MVINTTAVRRAMHDMSNTLPPLPQQHQPGSLRVTDAVVMANILEKFLTRLSIGRAQ